MFKSSKHREGSLELLPPIKGMNNIAPPDMLDSNTATRLYGRIIDNKIKPILKEEYIEKEDILTIEYLQKKLVIYYSNGEVHDLNGKLFSLPNSPTKITACEYDNAIVTLSNGGLHNNGDSIYKEPFVEKIRTTGKTFQVEDYAFVGNNSVGIIGSTNTGANGYNYNDDGSFTINVSLFNNTAAYFGYLYHSIQFWNNGTNVYYLKTCKNGVDQTDYKPNMFMCNNRCMQGKVTSYYKDLDNQIKVMLGYEIMTLSKTGIYVGDNEVFVGIRLDSYGNTADEVFTSDGSNIYIYDVSTKQKVRTISKPYKDNFVNTNPLMSDKQVDYNSVLKMFCIGGTYITIYRNYVAGKDSNGADIKYVNETYISVNFAAPSKTQSIIKGAYEYDNKIYIMYADGSIGTLSLDNFVGELIVKSGRLGLGYKDTLIYSSIGDITQWDTSSTTDDGAKEIEIGYKEAGEIRHLKTISDVMIYKDNNYWYRLIGDYPDWSVNKVAESIPPTSNIVAIGTELIYGTASGIKKLSPSQVYGDYLVEDLSSNINVRNCKNICITKNENSILFVLDGIYEYQKDFNCWSKISHFTPDKLIDYNGVLYGLKDKKLYKLVSSNEYSYQYARAIHHERMIVKSVTLWGSGKGTLQFDSVAKDNIYGTVRIDIGNGKIYKFNIKTSDITKQKTNQIATTKILQPTVTAEAKTGNDINIDKIIIEYAIIGDE